MKHMTFAVTLMIACSLAWADFTGLPEYVTSRLGAIQKYPNASSIVLWCAETYALKADGSQSYEWHSFRYFPDEAARDVYGDPRISYAEGEQKVEILRARTYTRDGRQIDCTPENAYNPVVPDGLDLAPEFSAYRQLVVTLLGLENGSISEFHYRVTTPEPLLPWLEGRVYLREEIPVIARELTVEVPTGLLLISKGDNGAPEPSINGSRYVWQVGEQAGYAVEDLAGHRVLLPNVAFTTAQEWSEVCSYLSGQIEDAEREPVLVPEVLKEELVGEHSVEARLNVIRSWVRERFKKLQFEHPEFAVSLRPARDVLNSGYGNGFELAVLVRTLAAANGLRTDLAPRFLPESPVPSLHEWADPVLVVHSDLGTTYLTDALEPKSKSSLEFEVSTIFDLTSCMERETPARVGGEPRFNLWLTLEHLNGDTVNGHGSLIAVGNWGAVEGLQEQGAEDYLNSLITLPGFNCGKARIHELTDRGRVSVDFEFSCDALDTAGDYHTLPLSALTFNKFVEGAPWSLTSREFAQELPMVGRVQLVIDAKIPADWHVSRKPQNTSQTWDWSTGEINCEVRADHVSNERTLNLAREWLAPSGWAGFREWIIESGPRPNNIIVFAPKTTGAAQP